MQETELILENFSITEVEDWMKNAVKHKGRLSKDLGLEKGQRLSDLSPDIVIAYALKSPENKKRVLLARSFYVYNPNRKHTRKDKRFWDRITKGLKTKG